MLARDRVGRANFGKGVTSEIFTSDEHKTLPTGGKVCYRISMCVSRLLQKKKRRRHFMLIGSKNFQNYPLPKVAPLYPTRPL